jgi:hypothetical protein
MPGPPASARVLPAAAADGLCVLVGAVGVVSLPAMVPWWVVIGVIAGGSVYLGALARVQTASPQAACECRDVGVLAGLATTAACVVIVGLVALLDVVSGPVIFLVLFVSAPRMWHGLQRGRRWIPGAAGNSGDSRTAHDQTVFVPVVVVELPPAQVSTPELCLAWRRSYLALVDTPSGQARNDIVRLRRDLLDELERRDHAGFSRWIETGARAGSDPGRYLRTDRHG